MSESRISIQNPPPFTSSSVTLIVRNLVPNALESRLPVGWVDITALHLNSVLSEIDFAIRILGIAKLHQLALPPAVELGTPERTLK